MNSLRTRWKDASSGVRRAVESHLGRFLLYVASLLLIINLVDANGPNFPYWLVSSEPGDSLAAWIEALATVGAFVAAVVAVRYSWRLLQHERALREANDLAHERAVQADRVAVWMLPNGRTMLSNSSDMPVFDVAVAWVNGDDRRGVEVGSWAPGQQDKVAFPYEAGVQDRLSGAGEHWEKPRDYQVMVRFRDAAGRIWERDQFGVLGPPTRMTHALPLTTPGVSEIVANWTAQRSH